MLSAQVTRLVTNGQVNRISQAHLFEYLNLQNLCGQNRVSTLVGGYFGVNILPQVANFVSAHTVKILLLFLTWSYSRLDLINCLWGVTLPTNKFTLNTHDQLWQLVFWNLVASTAMLCFQELIADLRESKLSAAEINKASKGLEQDFPLGIAECGADALRFTLCSYNVLGNVCWHCLPQIPSLC